LVVANDDVAQQRVGRIASRVIDADDADEPVGVVVCDSEFGDGHLSTLKYKLSAAP
jgi:hypothetical protein